MNRPSCLLLLVLSLVLLGSPLAHGAVMLIGEYHLGEAGSISGGTAFTPLLDTAPVGTANNITNFQGVNANASLITTGLAAPGSTAALHKTLAANTGWFGNSSAFGLTDNFAVDLWIRPETKPATGNGTVAFSTDASTAGISIWYQSVANGGDVAVGYLTGGTGQELVDGPAYTLGEWQRLTMITLNKNVHFYVDGEFQGSSGTVLTNLALNAPRIGFGSGELNSTSAAFDELRIYSFAGTDSLSSIETVVFGLPEPQSYVMWSLGALVGLAWAVRQRRRRYGVAGK